MGDPVSERAHYLAVRAEGSGDLFLIQEGRVEHLGLLRAAWRRARPEARSEPRRPATSRDGRLGRAMVRVLALVLALAL
jgi:hypothetical protein